MSGRWISYVIDDEPKIVQLVGVRQDGHRTRKAAIKALRGQLEIKYRNAQEKLAETGRALAKLAELEEA
jgi:hypothetical protein